MLVKTSNPSSGELQNRDMEGKPLYARMAEMVAKNGARSGYAVRLQTRSVP